MKLIPYGAQYVDKEDILAVKKVLKEDKITTGVQVERFERKLNNFLGVKFSSVCNSGTSALFLALKSIGIKKDDIIIMPSITFVASYNVAKYLGARVFLADIDKLTGQMLPDNVLKCCKHFKIKKIKALILMYNGGYPLNAGNFLKLKKQLGCYIIEDACHALGAEYKFQNKFFKIGSCKHCDISTFSLHPIKSITTGEGGIVTTNSNKLNNKIKLLRSHGILRNKNKHWKYNVIYHGLNFRLNDFQCALGISQLNKIKKFILKRKEISKKYDKELKSIKKINLLINKQNLKPSYHLYFIKLKSNSLLEKEKLIKFMLKKKILLQYHYIPLYRFKIFRDKYLNRNAEIYYKSTVSLPIYYSLKLSEQNYIINNLKKFFLKNG